MPDLIGAAATIREATIADAPALAFLHGLAFERPWSVEAFEGLLGDGLVAGQIAGDGFILWRALAGEAEILTLAVAPAARRQGLARALLTGAVKAARAAGADAMFLEVAVSNAAAIGLYDRAGFERTGRRKGYYETAGEREDALTMRLALTADAAPPIV